MGCPKIGKSGERASPDLRRTLVGVCQEISVSGGCGLEFGGEPMA